MLIDDWKTQADGRRDSEVLAKDGWADARAEEDSVRTTVKMLRELVKIKLAGPPDPASFDPGHCAG